MYKNPKDDKNNVSKFDELQNLLTKLDANIESMGEELDEELSLFDELADHEGLERLFSDDEIIKVKGRAVFNKLPDPSADKFTFYIRGKTKRTATIDRSRFTCSETLHSGKKYEFFCAQREEELFVESFEPIGETSKATSSLISDTENKFRQMGWNLFTYDCELKHRGIKIFLELTGSPKNIIFKDDQLEFDIQCKEGIYQCVMDKSMTVQNSVEDFIQAAVYESISDVIDNKIYIGTLPGNKEYVMEGILVSNVFYVHNLWENQEETALPQSFPKEIRKHISKEVANLPEDMKKEILAIIENGTEHPIADKSEASSFVSFDSLKSKYKICRCFYPVPVQNAIEKIIDDRSLKESQRISILKLLINTPWSRKHPLNTDAAAIKKGMDETHYGLEHLKNELIKLVVSNSKKQGSKGANILLVGAPGVGKTSLVKRFASLYNIPFKKISLNGIDTPYFLKGTPRLYDNAIIGCIARTVHEVGDNSLILLDEVDKMTQQGKDGNPYSALYDLLDKDELFQDEMIEAGIDLSNTVFVLTANDIANVPPAIIDRVEVIYVDDYSFWDKMEITSRYVIPEIMTEYGLDISDVIWEDGAVAAIADRFTLSNGVRDIKRNVVRVVKSIVMQKTTKEKITVNKENVKAYLDIKHCRRTKVEREIAALKRKFQYFKTEYIPVTRKKICDLFKEYDSADTPTKELIRKKLFCLVNILPSGKKHEYNINKVRDMLNETHYGMEQVKEQILMHLCAAKTSASTKTKCLLLNGMSGIGKTTICHTLARAMGLPFVKISLNGISNPEKIKGFEPGWKNAEPGVIVSSLSEAGTSSAFILLDEIDKMSANKEKDPYSALLDLFDNAGGFTDTFCGVPVDLSDCFIVATSNYAENIPMAVIDRMEVIDLGGYTMQQKTEIATGYIIPKMLSRYNLEGSLFFTSDAVYTIVYEYCKTYGMRDVEKAVDKIICKLLLENKCHIEGVTVNKDAVCRILGAKAIKRGNVSSNVRPGMARALAVSGNTGTTFAIEVVENPYAESDEVTGLPKQSLTDSIKIAKMLASKYLKKQLPKLHIHFAEGGIEKDGPSAGITVFSAIYSYFSGISIPREIGFSGEINLYGDVWAIGGVELKITAAINEGCKKVFIPYDNYIHLEEDNKLNRFNCEIVPVKHIEDIIDTLFCEKRKTI